MAPSHGNVVRQPATLAVVVAGLLVLLLWIYVWVSYRGSVPSLGNTPVFLLVGIGLVAGFASGRFRDAIVAWAAGLLATFVAGALNYAIDPSWPQGETPLALAIVLWAAFLLPILGGGHLLGVLIRSRVRR